MTFSRSWVRGVSSKWRSKCESFIIYRKWSLKKYLFGPQIASSQYMRLLKLALERLSMYKECTYLYQIAAVILISPISSSVLALSECESVLSRTENSKYEVSSGIQENIPRPIKSYFIDEAKKADLFADAPNDKIREIYEKLIENLQHITFNQFLIELDKLIPEIEKIKEDYVLIHEGDLHSKKWVYSLIESKLSHRPIAEFKFNSKELFKPDYVPQTFLILDDGAFSGRQIEGVITTILLNASNAHFSKPLKFFVATPFISSDAIRLINDINVKWSTVYSNFEIKIMKPYNIMLSTREVLEESEIKELGIMDSIYTDDFWLRTCLLYFDHKKPDFQSLNSFLYYLIEDIPRAYDPTRVD